MHLTFLDSYTLNPGDLNLDILSKFGICDIYESTSPELIIERAISADILITNKCIIDQRVIEALPNLKYIQVSATGYNNIDIQASKMHKIPVSNVSGYSTSSVAQHTFAMILAYLNQVESYAEESTKGIWSSQANFSYWHSAIHELAGKTLGIIGLGTIGQSVAKIGRAFDMKITSLSRGPMKDVFDDVQYLDREEFFRSSDILTLHCPLNEETKHIINKETLSIMKPTSILVNTSRGGAIHESDLRSALEQKQISVALLDVLSSEPPAHEHILLDAPNCLITPHQAWASLQSRERLLHGIVSNIEAFIAGYPQNMVTL